MTINEKTTLRELSLSPEYKQIGRDLLTGGTFYSEDIDDTLEDLHRKHPHWAIPEMYIALDRLAELEKSGEKYVFELYTEEEIEEDPDKEEVKVVYMPAYDHDPSRPYAVLTSGGGYRTVCSLTEAYSVSARLNELGITCFAVNYRTTKQDGRKLLPGPIDDLAKAMGFIEDNKEKFHVDPDNYFIAGFSAGGHLAGEWGTDNHGAKTYGISSPKFSILMYPAVAFHIGDELPENRAFIEGVLGKGCTLEDVREYDITRHIGPDYPDVYFIQAKNDPFVNVKNADYLFAALDKAGIPFVKEITETGGHGFGLGNCTELAGWPERVLKHFGVI